MQIEFSLYFLYMKRRMIRWWLWSGLMAECTQLVAQEVESKETLRQVSYLSVADTSLSVQQPAKRSFLKRFLDYFNDANKEKKNKKFDFSVIGGPHYSSDTKLGLGLVAAGTIFHDFASFQSKHILPNYGVGYRWEFKKRVNVRLDLGFGKHQTGFIFNINEAF